MRFSACFVQLSLAENSTVETVKSAKPTEEISCFFSLFKSHGTDSVDRPESMTVL